MTKISTEEFKEGMILEEDVLDNNGRLLLPKDSVLSEKHRRVFKTWGVTHINIKHQSESSSKVSEANQAQQFDAVISELKDFFKHNDLENPLIKELFRICVLRSQSKS